jgi:ketosteroid isomerase-like protein
MSTQEQKVMVRQFLNALVNDDTGTMRTLVRDDVTWWVPQSGVDLYGLARRMDGWDDVPWFGGEGWKGFRPGTSKVIVHHLVAEDDLVSAHYNREAERLNGSRYDTEYNILFRFEDGLIAEVWEIADTAQARASAT